MINYLKANKWIDLQTRSILIESNYLHKSSGMYIMYYTVMELLMDFYTFSHSARFITPVFQTINQILYTVLSTVAGLIIIIYSILELKRSRADYNIVGIAQQTNFI